MPLLHKGLRMVVGKMPEIINPTAHAACSQQLIGASEVALHSQAVDVEPPSNPSRLPASCYNAGETHVTPGPLAIRRQDSKQAPDRLRVLAIARIELLALSFRITL
jgi:hypothetical protein